jgi:hypothetical protein
MSMSRQGDEGERTYVSASGHPHDDVVVSETVLLHDLLELGNEDGKVSLRLGHGETAVKEEANAR